MGIPVFNCVVKRQILIFVGIFNAILQQINTYKNTGIDFYEIPVFCVSPTRSIQQVLRIDEAMAK